MGVSGSHGSDADPHRVDVLIVGGGMQGLVLLEALSERGFSSALVSDAPLGHGQALHGHGLLESGYMKPKPELRASVVQDWLPYMRRNGVDVYGEWFVISPDDPLEQLRPAWEAGGYPYEVRSASDLPDAYRGADLSSAAGRCHVVAIDDYCFPKRQLIAALARGHEGRIVLGEPESFAFEGTAGELAVESVDVRLRERGERLRIAPRYLFLAAGAGTPALVESLAGAVDAEGGGGGRVRASLDPVSFDKLHMLTLRGRAEDLPDVSVFVPPKGLKIVSHLNNRHAGRGGGDLVTWYVTNEPLSVIDPARADGSAEAAVDPAHAADGFNRLFSLAPALRERARDGRIEFFVFAGCKQGIGGEVNVQHCEPVGGLANAALALPSLAGGAWITAGLAVALIEEAIEPSPADGPVPGAGPAPVGEVTELAAGSRWLGWDELLEAYSGIDR